MFKKFTAILLILMLVPGTQVQGIFTINRTVRMVIGEKGVTINGDHFDNADMAFIYDGRIMVPLRLVGGALANDATWHEDTRTLSIWHDGQRIYLRVDEPLEDDMGIVIIRNGRSFVPVEFLIKRLDLRVRYDGANQAVYINRVHTNEKISLEEQEEMLVDLAIQLGEMTLVDE